jgi:hypothetical protein
MKKKYSLILSLLSVLCLNAQNFIEHPINNPDNNTFANIKLHDLDSDGNIDIIGAMTGSSQLMAWFGSGNGVFEDSIIIESEDGQAARDIELLDINNDGYMDIIAIEILTVNGNSFDRLVYYINNGDRTFENFTLVDPGVGTPLTNFFSVFDVDNNNFDDIVTRDSAGNLVYYPNTGNSSFDSPISILNNIPREIYAQDFNNDTLIDILICGGTPQLLLNNGDATFTMSNAFNDYPVQQFATLTSSGQFDANNTRDVLFTNTNFSDESGVIWYSNDGNANFTFQENIGNPSIINNVYSIARIVDFNNDGNNDLIAGIRFSPGVGIPYWINDGDNNFTPSILESTSDDIDTSLEIFDFNNDNKMDFIVGTRDGKLTWFENNIPLSIEDNSIHTVSIAPNPSEGFYTITNNLSNQLYTIHVYNALGQIVSTVQNSNIIDLSSQSSGIYFAKIEDQLNGSVTSKKLIKL